jgi:glycosyltransferase involved in cell wall biosynthesis
VDARVLVGAESWLGPSKPIDSLRSASQFMMKSDSVRWREECGAIYGEFPTLVIGRLGGAARAFSYVWGLRRVLKAVRREFPFQLVHAHTALLDGAAALETKRVARVPVILTEHTGPFGVLTKTPGMRRRVKRAIVEADRVLAVSHALKRTMQQIFPDLGARIDVVPNGVDQSIFYPRPRIASDNDAPTVLWIGFFDGLKRPLLALSAFALAARRIPSLRMRFVGRGPLERDLKRAIGELNLEDRVRVEDYKDRTTLASSIANAHVLLVTSTVETFSLVTAEALSTGIPVVSTRCGGPEELISEPWLGRVTDDSPEALSDALFAIVNNLADFPAERLHAYARKRFGMEVVVGRLQAIYRDVLGYA